MCQVFAGQPVDDYQSETRSMRLNGHCTSIRLERLFWRVLEDIAARDGVSVPQFVATLHDEVLELNGEVSNFTSLLRCACLVHLSRRGAEAPASTVIAAE